MRDTTAEKLAEPIATATFAAVYQDEGRILGVISLPRPNLVQLFFVAPTHLRRGIGRTLWEAARAHIEEKHPEVKTIELNSSLYAVSTYKALGFYPISEPFRRKGSMATRMACWLPGRALERAQNSA
jgi:GNAT superfamily N-acetyltransferase